MLNQFTAPLNRDFFDNSTPIPFAGCFIWMRASHPRGYGHFTENGKTIKAHHRAWEIQNGPIPKGLEVLHSCDTPSCINPRHLFLGTQADNMRDMRAKGRRCYESVRGERSPVAKYTAELILALRARFALGGISQSQLADENGIPKGTIGAILNGSRWKHLDAPTV